MVTLALSFDLELLSTGDGKAIDWQFLSKINLDLSLGILECINLQVVLSVRQTGIEKLFYLYFSCIISNIMGC